jgi:hypothetical protein
VERKKTTVIITTHYIEEARQSDKVSFADCCAEAVEEFFKILYLLNLLRLDL